MRQVGDVQGDKRAARLVRFLAAQGIASQARDDGDERFSIWVINEDHVAAADEHFRAFKIAPDAAVFDVQAPPVLKPPLQQEHGALGRSRYIDVRTEIFGRGRYRSMPVTVALIVLSCLATLLYRLPATAGLAQLLFYSNYINAGFIEITHGQVWRLVTPVFLHEGILHLLFNMIWLYQLGGAIEIQEGSAYVAGLCLIVAAIVNTAQFLVSGPLFLGMSGVVYALLGYIWIMSLWQTRTRYAIPRETVYFMIGWLVICLLGILPGPQAANTEHIVGLLLGVIFGFLRSGHIKTMLRRSKFKKNMGG